MLTANVGFQKIEESPLGNWTISKIKKYRLNKERPKPNYHLIFLFDVL